MATTSDCPPHPAPNHAVSTIQQTAASELQRNTLFPDRNLTVVVQFVLCLFLTRRDAQDEIDKPRLDLIDSGGAGERVARAEIDPVRLFFAISLFDDISSVGTGKPSGVPRPVVNSTRLAPLATSAVTETLLCSAGTSGRTRTSLPAGRHVTRPRGLGPPCKSCRRHVRESHQPCSQSCPFVA